MNRSARGIAIVVGALVLFALVWWQLKAPAPMDTSAPASSPQRVARPPEAPPATGPSTVTQRVSPPAKRIAAAQGPRRAPPPTHVELTPPPAKSDDSRYWVPPPETNLRDRRETPGPHAARERVAVGYALDTLDDDIEDCLDQWRKTQVSLQGSLMLSIEIDAKGVKKAWVDTDAGIPLGPQSCFSNAVYGIDWSHMVDSPAKITRPYSFDQDGGS